jgi:hypothetical protein
MARSTLGQDDRDTSEACEPRHEFQRRSSILDDENKLFFEQLDGLDGGYKEFLTWNTKDQEQAFDKMVEFLNEARDLPYLLAYKPPLRYKPPRFISPLLAKGRCKICMAHRPSTIVNPFSISPLLREGICLARATWGGLIC